MNKKILGITIGVLILAVLVIGGALLLKKKSGVDLLSGVTRIMTPSLDLQTPAKYLPENTLLFYSMSDVEGLWDGVVKSKFWEELKKLRLWTDIAFQDNLNKALAVFKTKIGMELTQSRIMDIFGKRFTVAVLLGQNSEDVNVFLQTHVSKKTDFLEAILQTFIKQTVQNMQETTYQDEKIFFLPASSPDQPEVRYTLVNGLLTVAVGKTEASIKNIIDLLKGSGGVSLSQNPNYESSQKFLNDDQNYHILSFMDFTRLSTVLPKVIEPLKKAQPNAFKNINLDEISKNLQQIKCVCARGAYGNDGLLNVKTFIVPDLDKMSADQKTQWTQTEESLQAIDFSPLESLAVNFVGNVNAGQLWKNITDAAAASVSSPEISPDETKLSANPLAGFMNAISAWQTQSGVRVQEDLMDQIGEELGFVFSGLNFEGQLPVPRFGIILKAKDAPAFYSKLNQILEKTFTGPEAVFALNLQKKTLQGAEITVLETQFGEGLSPVIGHLDSWIFLASNEAFADKILLTKAGSTQKLSEKGSFQKIIPDANGKATQISFMDLAGISTMLKNLVNEVLKKNLLLAIPNGSEITSSISTYVLPILEILPVFDSSGFSSRKQDSVLVQNMNLQIHDLSHSP